MSMKSRIVGKVRLAATDGSLDNYQPKIVSDSDSLRFVGRYSKGYSIEFQRDVEDSFVKQAMLDLYGTIPKQLKRWTRSGGNIDDLRASVQRYTHRYAPAPNTWWFKKAVKDAFAAFRLPSRLKPLPLDEVSYISSSSAGFTWQGFKKGDVWELAVAEAAKLWKLEWNGQLSKRLLPPAMAFKRTQLYRKGEKVKLRAVWGQPFEMILIEGMFADPLIQAYKAWKSPMFIGRHQLKEVPIVIDNACSLGQCFVTDMSGFDATVPPYGIKICFDVLKQNLELADMDRAAYDLVVQYFIKTPIMLPDGERYVKYGGIPSGSYFTQMVGSIWNFIIITAAQYALHGKAWTTYTLGDDSFQEVPEGESISMLEWAQFFDHWFNMTMSSTKSQLTSNPSEVDFLGHTSVNGRVARDAIKALRLALYPEYPVEDASQSLVRVMMLYADTGSRNRTLREIMQWFRMNQVQAFGEADRWMRYVAGVDFTVDRMLSDAELFALA